uniref:C-type lectin domain-containing protein n=1 Tax=Caenorhabditis tropicalis TaxID=1561998 RepID=A0A1I7UYK6_9PELO
MTKMSAPLLLLILIPLFLAAPCKDSDLTDCGCVKRPTFEQSWLEATYPDVAAMYPPNTFSAATTTYECDAVSTSCPTGYKIVALDLRFLNMSTDPRKWTNPSTVPGIECRDGIWYKDGLMDSVQENFVSTSLACMKS